MGPFGTGGEPGADDANEPGRLDVSPDVDDHPSSPPVDICLRGGGARTAGGGPRRMSGLADRAAATVASIDDVGGPGVTILRCLSSPLGTADPGTGGKGGEPAS